MLVFIPRALVIFCLVTSLGSQAEKPDKSRAETPSQEARGGDGTLKRASLGARRNARAVAVGLASWYGRVLNGHRTASGERFDMGQYTAAHRSLPFGTLVQVTNLQNGRSVVVRVNDRGIFSPGRIIDLSYAAAVAVNMRSAGVVRVRLEVIEPVTTAQALQDPLGLVPDLQSQKSFGFSSIMFPETSIGDNASF